MSKKMEQVLGYAQATLQVSSAHKLVLLDFIPVEERKPKNRVHVFVLNTIDGKMGECYWAEGWFWAAFWEEEGVFCSVAWTHWAEIPPINQ